MTATNKSSLHPILLIAGIAVILFCGVGAAAIMGWLPSSMGRNAADNGQLSNADKTLSDSMPASSTSQPTVKHDVLPAHKTPVRVAKAVSDVPRKAVCSQCGVIESIRTIETRGDSNGVGAAGGAVVGGLLGNQVGGGHGKDAMTVAGVIGGALVGNQIERKSRTTRSYEVVVHLDQGGTRSIHQADASGWHTGDHVKFVNGELRAN